MSPPRAAGAPFPAGSCSGRPITPPCSRWSARCVTTITSWNRARRPRAATACRRRSRSVCCRPAMHYALCQLCRRLPCTVDHGDSRRRAACRRVERRCLLRCPSGTPALPAADSTFCFVPNPNLRPEVGKNKEIGFNFRKNGLFVPGDSFRGKFNVFRNDIEDYIDQVQLRDDVLFPADRRPRRCSFLAVLQYQNIAEARIQGVEARDDVRRQ